MIILKVVLYIGIILFIVVGLLKVIWTRYLNDKKFIRNSFDKNNLNTQFLILIPVFKEEKIIRKTISYFKSVVTKNVKVFYITTDKEVCNAWDENSTLKILSEYVDSEYIINYPYKIWDKASQLNYAIQYLLEKYTYKNLYFWIFDADSEPNFWVIDYISNDKIKEPVYQMLSIYNTNYNKVSKLCKANAILQTRWSFYFEYDRLFKNYTKGLQKNLMYLIWHGIFIRSDIIKYNLFPEDSITEDIAYWYNLCLCWIFAKPIPYYYDYCSVPNDIFSNIKQISRRFYWEFELILNFIHKKNKSKNLFLQRLFELILWWYWWLVILAMFFISIFIHSWSLLVLLFFWLLFDCISFYIISKKSFKNNWEIVIIYLFSLLKNILDAVPLSISLINLLNNFIIWKKQNFYKTDR